VGKAHLIDGGQRVHLGRQARYLAHGTTFSFRKSAKRIDMAIALEDVRGSTKSGSPGIDYTHAGLPPAVIHARFDARFPELKVVVDFEQA